MKYYKSYMDRQELSPQVHERLLNLEPPRRRSGSWLRYGALAACAALVLGLGVWGLTSSDSGSQTVQDALYPGIKDWYGPGEIPPDSGDKTTFPFMPDIAYSDTAESGEIASRIALPNGSFFEALTEEDLVSLFGEEDPLNTQLGWEGAELSAYFIFTAEGNPWEGTVTGRRVTGGADDFYAVLTLAPDALPLSCTVSPADGVTQCWGVEVTGRYGGTYGEGSDKEVWLPESREVEFVAHGVGFRLRVYGQEGEGERVEAMVSRFVRYAIADGGVDLSCLTVDPSDIPEWREEEFSTLAQARQEADFAPYLPTSAPEGYGEFYGRLSYQKGTRNTLFVRWSRGYDNVEVAVYRDETHPCHLADPDQPETYDLRLYPIPWCDSVPQEYWDTVNDPAFWVEDMSLSIVEARGREHDTGGMTWSFNVLHPHGTLVSYHCDGLTAQQVWELVRGAG